MTDNRRLRKLLQKKGKGEGVEKKKMGYSGVFLLRCQIEKRKGWEKGNE